MLLEHFGGLQDNRKLLLLDQILELLDVSERVVVAVEACLALREGRTDQDVIKVVGNSIQSLVDLSRSQVGSLRVEGDVALQRMPLTFLLLS